MPVPVMDCANTDTEPKYRNGNTDTVGNLPEGYIRNVRLPRVPRDQSTFQSRVPHVHTIPHYYEDTYGIPTYKDTCRIGERVATANSP
jgi:hypothetical protein